MNNNYFLFEFDLSQAENRIVAYIAPDQTMIQTFESGIDVHKKTASLIFDCPVEEITSEQRRTGKQSNHSLNYDMGYRSFGLHWMIPETRAKWIVEKYHIAYPGVRQWHGRIQSKIKQDRILTNLMGRKRKFFGRMGDSLFKEGYAFIPQSTVADIINEQGILKIWEDPYFEITVLLNQVHDAVVGEIPHRDPRAAYEQLTAIKKSLEIPLHANGREFVIPADLKIGRRLLDTKAYIETQANRRGGEPEDYLDEAKYLGMAKKCKLDTYESFSQTLNEVLDATPTDGLAK